ncbi:hypothetical protein KPA97_69990, partial [Burkholderia cenocepacia]|nr:hypothetical protein [Burkholderia cenocepacia]
EDANLLEAQGLGEHKGNPGQSGIATSKVASTALSQAAGGGAGERGYVYLIDTRRFAETDRAYDLTHTLAEAGHLQAGQAADGHDDPTGATVNATRVP